MLGKVCLKSVSSIIAFRNADSWLPWRADLCQAVFPRALITNPVSIPGIGYTSYQAMNVEIFHSPCFI